jgi:hypothetical protein
MQMTPIACALRLCGPNGNGHDAGATTDVPFLLHSTHRRLARSSSRFPDPPFVTVLHRRRSAMVPADVINPLVLIGREIRIEFTTVFDNSAVSKLVRRLRSGPDQLSGQRPDDLGIIERRKAEAMLLAVRHGAVRR